MRKSFQPVLFIACIDVIIKWGGGGSCIFSRGKSIRPSHINVYCGFIREYTASLCMYVFITKQNKKSIHNLPVKLIHVVCIPLVPVRQVESCGVGPRLRPPESIHISQQTFGTPRQQPPAIQVNYAFYTTIITEVFIHSNAMRRLVELLF